MWLFISSQNVLVATDVLWQSLRKVLHRTSETFLPAHSSEKSLADTFASFFTNKISKIRDTFPTSGSFNDAPELVPCFLSLSLMALSQVLIKKASLPRNDFKNYCPVSGLCFLSKLVERVVAKQLTSHINNNKPDNWHQSAYKPGHSTETALLSIKNEVHVSLACGEPTALVLLHLSAAFDTIDHNILLGYMKSWFGLGGTVLKWFASYLSDRCQAIKIGSTLSELSKLIYGVTQGSVLGPLLFSLYTTPLSKIIHLHPQINSTSMRMTHNYTSISPIRMPLLLLPS